MSSKTHGPSQAVGRSHLREERAGGARTQAHSQTRIHPQSRASFPLAGGGGRGWADPKQTTCAVTLRPRCRMASAWCAPSGEPRPPRPPRSPTPRPSAPRPRPLGDAAGLYWAGAKVEGRRNSGRPAWRCSFGDPGRKGGYGRHGLRDSAPRALKAEGSILSPKGGTNTGWHHLRAPKIPARDLGPPVKNTSWSLEWIADAHASSSSKKSQARHTWASEGGTAPLYAFTPKSLILELKTVPTQLLPLRPSSSPNKHNSSKKIPAEEDSSTEK